MTDIKDVVADTTTPETVVETPAGDTTQGAQTFESLVGTQPTETKEETPPTIDPKDALIIEFKRESREDRKLIKEMAAALKELKSRVDNGAIGSQEAKDELDLLAEEHGVDPTFTKRLREIVLKDVEAKIPKVDVESALNNRISEQKRQEEADNKLRDALDEALQKDPRFTSVVKKDFVLKYIKTNVLTNKEEMKRTPTVLDVLDDLYGHVVGSHVETPGNTANNHDEKINYASPTDKDIKRINEIKQKTGQVPDDYINNLLARAGVQVRPKK